MKTDSRLAFCMTVVRTYDLERKRNNTHRHMSYDRNDLLAHVYICIEEYIKQYPVITNDLLHAYGLKCCRQWVKKTSFVEPVPLHNGERRAVTPIDCSEGRDTRELLSIWMRTQNKRQGSTLLTRLMGYLHLVEGMPKEEIAEVFDKTINAVHSHLYSLKKHTPMLLKKNDVVMLVMDNPFFHEMLAWVKEPTEYGAVVEVESHTYPTRTKWQLRCIFTEMVYIGTVNSRPDKPEKVEPVDGGKRPVVHAQDVHKGEIVYREVEPVPLTSRPRSKHVDLHQLTKDTVIHTPQGDIPIKNGLHDPNVYELDDCPACGKMRLRRNGPCMICDNCGESTGCG